MKHLIAILALMLAATTRADCQGQIEVCTEAQVDCVSPITRAVLFRCSRFSAWCIRNMNQCSQAEKDVAKATLWLKWMDTCRIVATTDECAELSK